MLTLLDINRALDRLGPLAFVPRTRPELAMYVSMAPSRPNRGRSEKNLARPPGRARSMSPQRSVEGGDTRRLVLVVDRLARRREGERGDVRRGASTSASSKKFSPT
jgi:hypothetical protein